MSTDPPVIEEVVPRVLDDAVTAMEDADIPYVVIGGIPTSVYGERKHINDIDLFVAEQDAERALQELDAAGFSTEKKFEDWLYKAHKHDILVDIIFKSGGDIRLDDEMIENAHSHEVVGRNLLLVSPEDLVVMLAASHKEDTTYWFDALRVLAHRDLDWAYLVRRAVLSPLRTLSLLLFARSEGTKVPEESIERLYSFVRSSRD